MRPGVEFLVPPDDEPETAARRQRPRVHTVIASGAVVAVVVLVALTGPGYRTPAPRPAPPRPSPRCTTLSCSRPDAPTTAMEAAFQRVLPGSVVVAEHSVASHNGGPALARRTIEAVSGNVVIMVLVRPASGPARAPHGVVDVEHGSYRIQYRFRGYYAPTRAQLDTLSGDPRLTSPRA